MNYNKKFNNQKSKKSIEKSEMTQNNAMYWWAQWLKPVILVTWEDCGLRIAWVKSSGPPSHQKLASWSRLA
jgi:hypothetical protein